MPAETNASNSESAIATVAALWTLVCVAPWLVLAIQSPETGWDFPVFYIAGKLPVHLLYNREAFAEYWRHYLQPLGSPHWAAYVRPSIFSLLLRPLAAIPYTIALRTWMAVGLAAYLASIILLLRRFQVSPLLLPAFVFFFPAMRGMIGGGDTTLYLLALVAGFLLLERGCESLAGLCFVFCLCKFNLVLLIPAMLLLQRRFKALTVFSCGAGLVAGASMLLTPLRDYVTAITMAQEHTTGFFPVGLRGASMALGIAWCYPIFTVVTIVVCLWLMWRLPLAGSLSVAITGSLMISPYICWYDSTLLAFAFIVLWSGSGKALRVACVLIILAVPLWVIGGGYMGAGGFTHIGVEMAIVAYYGRTVLMKRDRDGIERPAVERTVGEVGLAAVSR